MATLLYVMPVHMHFRQ